MATPLRKTLFNDQDRSKVIHWDNLVPMLHADNSVSTTEVTEFQAAMYDGDFYGLLRNCLEVEEQYLYPMMLANGFKCPSDYRRNIRKIKLLNSEAIKQMLLVINKKT